MDYCARKRRRKGGGGGSSGERETRAWLKGVRGYSSTQVTMPAAVGSRQSRVRRYMHVRMCARVRVRDAFRKCALICLPSTFAAAATAAELPPIEPSNFRFLRQDPVCMYVYVCLLFHEKAHVLVYLAVMYVHVHARRLCARESARIDRRDGEALERF